MAKMRVMTIIGTRPEIIKLSRVIAELDQHTDHILVHTGQNHAYELNELFFQDLEVRKPDHFLNTATETSTAAETVAAVIAQSDKIMRKEKPDALLVLGDTNSALSIYSAKRLKIPVFHMEAGNRCFDERVPEEINRRVADHMSDINLTFTEHARRYLLREGLAPERVLKTGTPMHEVIEYYKNKFKQSTILDKLGLTAKDYFVVSAHREENVDIEAHLLEILKTLNQLADKYNKKIVFSTHPRTRKRLEALGDKFKAQDKIQFMTAMGYFDYVKLQLNAYCTITDSGSITEEATILNFPAVTIREAHERPEGMDVGTLIMVRPDAEKIINAVEVIVDHYSDEKRVFAMVPDHASTTVSKQVLHVIMSYTDYVNRVVWHK